MHTYTVVAERCASTRLYIGYVRSCSAISVLFPSGAKPQSFSTSSNIPRS